MVYTIIFDALFSSQHTNYKDCVFNYTLWMLDANCFLWKKISLSPTIIYYSISHFAYSFFSVIIGVLNGNPGTIGFLRVNYIYYFLFIILISGIQGYYSFTKIIKVLLISSIFISVYSILLLLTNIGLWPDRFFINFDVTSKAGIHIGYTHLINTNLSMMIFLAPFSTILFLTGYKAELISKKLINISFILIIFAIIISGRRILWISLVLPILLFFFTKKNKHRMARLFFGVISLIIILMILEFLSIISLSSIFYRFFAVFQYNADGAVRIDQAKALWRGFLTNPIIGSGAGKGVSDIVRNQNSWVYELSYNLILFNSGIIGSTLYVISLLIIFFRLLSIYKNSYGEKKALSLAILLSYSSAIIGNATNPYFSSSFDFLWFIFIPLMYINVVNCECCLYQSIQFGHVKSSS